MTDENSVSVIICAHSDERRDRLRAALDSVRAQDSPAVEIIAVIDHNAALEAWVSAAAPDVTVIANRGERGLSAARNAGVQRARGAIVAFLDDDATAEAAWLTRMRSHYSDPGVIGAGGHVAPVWPEGRPHWLPQEFDWVVGCGYRGQPERRGAVRNLIGCNMSFRRAVFDRVGGFREGLGREGDNAGGCEETEFCIRAARAFPHSTIIYDPEMVVCHHIAPARVSWRYFRTRCLAEGRSKASMISKVGARAGLSSELRYTTRVLPAGVARGIGDALLRFDIAGLARAGAIVAGFGCVVCSYQWARWAGRNKSRAPARSFAPIRVVELDLARSLPDLPARDPKTEIQYGGAFCLVRSAGKPIRILEIRFDGEDLSATKLAALLGIDAGHDDKRTPAPAVSAAKAPFISVVVATRDRPASLARCLDSLLSQDYGRFDIVVVDNVPTSSETADLIARGYAPTGRVRYLRENRPGLGLAHNRGVKDIAAPIIAFTDDDVIVDPGWLSAVAAAFRASENVGCVTGLILPAELDTHAQYWIERHGGFGKGFERRVFDLGDNRPDGKLFPYAAGAFGSGANMAFRREALQRIGGFDPALGAGTPARGGDDLAAFVAVVRAGYQLVYEPQAIIWHHHRRGEEAIRRQAYGYGVGLGAYLTKLVVDEPAVLLRFARVFPAALAHLVSSSSTKNQRLPDDYPTALVWRERLGILAGVPAYLRARAALRRPPGPAHRENLLPASSEH